MVASSTHMMFVVFLLLCPSVRSAYSAGGGCQRGTYLSDIRRRFLHARPLSEPLLPFKLNDTIGLERQPIHLIPPTPTFNDYQKEKTNNNISLQSDTTKTPIYYSGPTMNKNIKAYKEDLTFQKLSARSGAAVLHFSKLTSDTCTIEWGEKLPDAPTPKMPLYWINLKSSKTRRENMQRQLQDLQWMNTTMIPAYNGKIYGYGYLKNKVFVRGYDIETLPCFHHKCKSTEVA
jgi:hypothetical protein